MRFKATLKWPIQVPKPQHPRASTNVTVIGKCTQFLEKLWICPGKCSLEKSTKRTYFGLA